MRVATDEDEPGAAIGYGEIARLAATSGNGRHGDMKKLAERLVQVLEPQLWPDLGRAKLEAKLPSARIDVGQRRVLLPEAGRPRISSAMSPTWTRLACSASRSALLQLGGEPVA